MVFLAHTYAVPFEGTLDMCNLSKIQEWVETGIFEIGICELPKLYDTLTHYPIQIPTKIVMHHTNPLRKHTVLTPELLRNENFILMGPDHTTQTQLFQAFEQANVKLKSSIHSHLFKNLLSFVKEDMGVALVDDFAIETTAERRFRRSSSAVNFPVSSSPQVHVSKLYLLLFTPFILLALIL